MNKCQHNFITVVIISSFFSQNPWNIHGPRMLDIVPSSCECLIDVSYAPPDRCSGVVFCLNDRQPGNKKKTDSLKPTKYSAPRPLLIAQVYQLTWLSSINYQLVLAAPSPGATLGRPPRDDLRWGDLLAWFMGMWWENYTHLHWLLVRFLNLVWPLGMAVM